jgi:hypothetical protein
MVNGITAPTSVFVAPAKPAPAAQAITVAGAATVAPPKQASNARPVHSAPAPDSEKDLPDQRAESPAPPPSRLSIGHDDAANRYVYRGVDGATKEVQKQWPTEEQLKRIAKLREMSGQIVDEIL